MNYYQHHEKVFFSMGKICKFGDFIQIFILFDAENP